MAVKNSASRSPSSFGHARPHVCSDPLPYSGGDFLIEREELCEQLLFGAEAVGGEDGGVQRGVSSRSLREEFAVPVRTEHRHF